MKRVLILILVVYVAVFIFLNLAYRRYYYRERVHKIISEINNSPKLSEAFYSIYDKCYNDRNESISKRYLTGFWNEGLSDISKANDNWQLLAARSFRYDGFRYQVAPLTLAFKINHSISPQKCFDFVMTNWYKEFCKTFQKTDTITNLRDSGDIISFIVACRRPHFYRVHPMRFKSETDSLKKILTLE